MHDFSFGVLIGSDRKQEWMLDWWLKRYRRHNVYPVCAADFGMSRECVRMLASRSVIVLKVEPIPKKAVWFSKPRACLESPFDYTIWLDSDMEVRGGLGPVFDKLEDHDTALVLNPYCPITAKVLREGEKGFGSGLVAWKRGSRIIDLWAHEVERPRRRYHGDQDALSVVVNRNSEKYAVLHRRYCRFRKKYEKPDRNAVIRHWHGLAGKQEIKKQIEREKALAAAECT